MAHFAKVVNNIVVQVIVAEQEYIDTLSGNWIQTSYNTKGGQHPQNKPLRKNYAGIGYTYDPDRDAFIPPQSYPSWTLNEDTCLWDPPVPYPTDDKFYRWNEETQSWDLVAE